MKKINGNFYRKSIISIDQFEKEDIAIVFKTATQIKKGLEKGNVFTDLKGKLLTALFYEPSSRTFGSFIASMQRLGGGIIPMHGMQNTSVKKGETLEDTIRVFASYSDVIVMRHPETGSVAKASRVSKVPIINAGDGIGEHPTQGLLDLYTVSTHFDLAKPLTIVMVGDLKYGRTVHSLSKLLTNYNQVKIIYVSPKELNVPTKITDYVSQRGVVFKQTTDFKAALRQADVLYMTRVQKERFDNVASYNKVKDSYILDLNKLKSAKKKMIIMHPLPRINEIATDVDNDPRAVYFSEQMKNGMYLRMALLKLILS